MSSLTGRVRFATLLAVGAILIASGLVVRAVEINPLKIGQENSSGVATTLLDGDSAEGVLQVSQTGTGSAVRGTTGAGTGVAGYFSSINGAGLVGISGSPDRIGITSVNSAETAGSGAALLANGGENVAVVASSNATGVVAATNGAGKAGIHAIDRSPDGAGYALVATGDASVVGSLSVTEGCVGCGSMVLGVNGSSVAVQQGQAVSVGGLEVGPDGSTVVVVRPAQRYEQVFGIVDRGLVAAASGDERTGIRRKWLEGQTTVPSGDLLRVAIGGLLTLDGELKGVRAGALLWVGTTPGDLVPTHLGVVSIGRYLGVRPDGRGVILIDIEQAT